MSNKGEVKVKFLPGSLKEAYEFDLKRCHQIEGLDDPLINVNDVLQAHYILADYFTDLSARNGREAMMAGLRNENLLASALGRQIVTYGNYRKYTDPIDICATLFYGLDKDHAFHDGNKRTALLVLLSQLKNYGYYPKNINEFEKLVLAIAEGSVKKKYENDWKKFSSDEDCEIKTISCVIRRNTKRKDHSYHLDINTRDFCTALSEHGVECKQENMKLKFIRDTKLLGMKPKRYTYTIQFYGWTRAVQAKMARDTFNALRLMDEYASFKSFVDGEKSLYKIINMFEVPFRRLRDE